LLVKNFQEISTIYSKDHATIHGARTCAKTGREVIQPAAREANDITPEYFGPLPKRPHTGEAILYMLVDMKTSFSDAVKSSEPIQIPQATSPSVILATLDAIPGFSRTHKLQAYEKIILNQRFFHALMELSMEFRNEWLLMLVQFCITFACYVESL
jgi:hypothetical protein